jgi:hypothetical protein
MRVITSKRGDQSQQFSDTVNASQMDDADYEVDLKDIMFNNIESSKSENQLPSIMYTEDSEEELSDQSSDDQEEE